MLAGTKTPAMAMKVIEINTRQHAHRYESENT